MLDFEENNKKLTELKNKLQQLGDSLWHYKFRTKVKTIRRKDNRTQLLEWF